MIKNNHEIIDFLESFKFWNIKRSSAGKYEVVVKYSQGEYIRVKSRKNEKLVALVERLRKKVDSTNQE